MNEINKLNRVIVEKNQEAEQWKLKFTENERGKEWQE